MTVTNCRCAIKTTESLAMGVPHTTGGGSVVLGARPVQYSVSNLVESVHRLERLCWHVVLLWKMINYIVRWESPLVTMSYWITSLLVCYFMEPGQMFASCFTLLLLLAGAGRLANPDRREPGPPPAKPQQPDGAMSSSLSAGSVQAVATTGTQGAERSAAEIDRSRKKGKEILAEYRQLMLLAQDGLAAVCEGIERVHAVLAWQDRLWSPIFYGGATIVLMMLCLLPLRWFVMATVSCALCLNWEFVAVVKQAYHSVHPPSLGQKNETKKNDNEKAEAPVASQEPAEPEQKEEQQPTSDVKSLPQAPPPIHYDTQHRPLHLCQKSKSLDEAGPKYAKLAAANRNRSSTAPELPTLKLNSSGVPVESCFLCGMMFTSVLKRRRYCRSCGNQFCQRCCTRKLPRSVFGATSPAALTEKELVCNACFCNMTADEVNQGPSSGSAATIAES